MFYSLKDISIELSLQPFSLREFLSQNGLAVAQDEGLDCTNVSNELYLMIKKQRSKITALESFRVAELEFKIQYLESEMSLLDINDYDFGKIHGYLDSELKLAKAIQFFREFEYEEVYKEDEGISTMDSFNNDDEDANEYSIYNSNGFVTWTFNLKEARSLASQFNGYIKDEYGREVY